MRKGLVVMVVGFKDRNPLMVLEGKLFSSYTKEDDAFCLYTEGRLPPRYPVPATMDNAVLALYHSPRITVWSVEWMKQELHKR